MSAIAQNGSLAKFYPNTGTTIENCLLASKTTNDRYGVSTILSANTVARLNAIEPLFRQARANVFKLKAQLFELNAQKDKARTETAMHTSHFLQVFNMGVARGKYSFAERALFQLPVEKPEVPKMHSDGKIWWAAEWVVKGEAKRIADGKEPMVNPSGAEVEAKYNQFVQLTGLVAKADSILCDEQIALRKLQKEARAIIKRVWNEVETYYCEGTRERMRKHARDWGVHYAHKGGEKKLHGTITDAATGLPMGGVKVQFENGNNKAYTNAQGKFTLVTNLLHSQTLLAKRSGYSDTEIVIELKEGEESFCAVKMDRLAE